MDFWIAHLDSPAKLLLLEPMGTPPPAHLHLQIHADMPGEGVHQHSWPHLFTQGWHVVPAVSSLCGQSHELENSHFLATSKNLYTYDGK